MNWKNILKDQRPDYPDLDGDGDTEEPMVDALETVEQVESVEKKVMPHTYGVETGQFSGMRDGLIKKLQDLTEDAFDAETDEANLELAIANLGKIIGDAKYAYDMEFGSEYYNVDKRRFGNW